MRCIALILMMSLALGSIDYTSTAQAQLSASTPAVIELYTSQGCSSCPPADALLEAYSKREDIVALSFNVDYWDYLGWKDTLAKRAYSERQRDYARARGDGEVYTPQVVINGRAHAVGSVAQQIELEILKAVKNNQYAIIPLKVVLQNGRLHIEVGADTSAKFSKPATIWLAAVRNKVTVPIRNGENRGRTISYYNVVNRITPVGMWSGEKTVIELMDEDVLQGNADTCAILVQYGKGGPIIAAQWMSVND